jgi:arginine/lysine/ornithine decarboxylase
MDEAVDQPTEMVPMVMAKDRIMGDYIYLYPPGIPLLVPGEILDERQIQQIEYYESQGLDVHGGYLKESKDVKVILHHG